MFKQDIATQLIDKFKEIPREQVEKYFLALLPYDDYYHNGNNYSALARLILAYVKHDFDMFRDECIKVVRSKLEVYKVNSVNHAFEHLMNAINEAMEQEADFQNRLMQFQKQ